MIMMVIRSRGRGAVKANLVVAVMTTSMVGDGNDGVGELALMAEMKVMTASMETKVMTPYGAMLVMMSSKRGAGNDELQAR